MLQEISSVNSQNKYVIPNWWSNIERELNMQANMKMKSGKNLKVKALVDFRCIHIEINEQLVKKTDTDQTDKLFIWSFQWRWNEEWRGDQSDATGNRNQQTQRIAGSCSNRFKWNKNVLRSWLVGQIQSRSQLEIWNDKIHKMSRKLQNETSGYWV